METLRELDLVRAVPTLTLRTAVGPHGGVGQEGEWDASANESRLPSPMSTDTARDFYAWYDAEAVEDGEINKADGKLPHHFVSSDGDPGAASLNGVRNALSRLPQTDGLSDSERATIERHLNGHLPDDDDDDESDSHTPRGSTRAADDEPADGGLAIMDVRFSPFNEFYEIDSLFEGRFLERTAPGAFKKTMRERRDAIRVLYDHGMDFQIGSKVLGPITDLREDTDAATGAVSLLDTSYNRDLLPGLRAGVYGASFRFRVTKQEWDDEPGSSKHNPEGLPERTIREVQLFEFGPVTFPANPAATAGVRCLTDHYYEKLRARRPEFVDELAQRARELRTPHGGAAPVGTPAGGAARHTEEPPAGALRGLTDPERERLLTLLALGVAS